MAGLSPESGGSFSAGSQKAFKSQLNKVYAWYTGGFIAFVVVLAIAEQLGLSRTNIGYVFLIATVLLYAGIGVMSRTNDASEYYVAGRRVPMWARHLRLRLPPRRRCRHFRQPPRRRCRQFRPPPRRRCRHCH